MTDKDRDDIDNEARSFMKQCVERIDLLKKELEIRRREPPAEDPSDSVAPTSPDCYMHHEGVLAFLYERLESVTQLYTQQRIIRFNQAMETKSFTNPIRASLNPSPSPFSSSPPSSSKGQLSKSDALLTTPTEEEDDGLQLDEKERKLLEEENNQLQNTLACLVDQAREVEKSVVEISHLQNLLATKVSEQTDGIDHLHKLIDDSTTNVNRSAQSLASATQTSATFRVYVLLFLIMVSLSLLFLNWYDS